MRERGEYIGPKKVPQKTKFLQAFQGWEAKPRRRETSVDDVVIQVPKVKKVVKETNLRHCEKEVTHNEEREVILPHWSGSIPERLLDCK